MHRGSVGAEARPKGKEVAHLLAELLAARLVDALVLGVFAKTKVGGDHGGVLGDWAGVLGARGGLMFSLLRVYFASTFSSGGRS